MSSLTSLQLLESVKPGSKLANIAKLTSSIVGSYPIPITLQLYLRMAWLVRSIAASSLTFPDLIQRWITVKKLMNEDEKTWWVKLDKHLNRFRNKYDSAILLSG